MFLVGFCLEGFCGFSAVFLGGILMGFWYIFAGFFARFLLSFWWVWVAFGRILLAGLLVSFCCDFWWFTWILVGFWWDFAWSYWWFFCWWFWWLLLSFRWNFDGLLEISELFWWVFCCGLAKKLLEIKKSTKIWKWVLESLCCGLAFFTQLVVILLCFWQAFGSILLRGLLLCFWVRSCWVFWWIFAVFSEF